MEFVDNALDDAEALYDPETGAYQRPVIIDVFVSRSSRTLRILTPTNRLPQLPNEALTAKVSVTSRRQNSLR